MRKLIGVFLFMAVLTASVPVQAATPLKSYMEIKDGRHIYVKTFEGALDEDPFPLRDKPFEQDGYSYTYYETAEEEISNTETRTEIQEVSARTDSDSIEAIVRLFPPEVDFKDEDGFTGKLLLDQESIKTEVEGYEYKSYTLTDTVTLMGLGSNDPVNIPKTRVKSGVTMQLKDVEWSAQETIAFDFEVIPSKYNAVAHYSGSYSKQVPTGYVSTVEYKGEVSKSRIEKVVFTLTYIGTELPKPTTAPTPMPTPASTPEAPVETEGPQEKSNSPMGWIITLIIGLLLIGGGLAAFFILYYNTFVYLKNGDEYTQIAKKRLVPNNPLVDLSSLDISGKEVAVNVKRQTAERLFGRYIKTVSDGGFSTRCLVNTQNTDFWYMVKVPADTDISESGKGKDDTPADLLPTEGE